MKAVISNRVLPNLSYSLFWIFSILFFAFGIAFLISLVDLDPVHIVVIFLIGLGGIAIFHYLRNDLVLAIYYWIILLWPYLFEIGDHHIKTSYLVIPLLCYAILIIILRRTARFKIYSHPIFILSALYTAIIFMSSLLNLRYGTSATYSFIALWLLGFTFFMLYLGYISAFDRKRVISLAENTLTVLVWIGLIAVIVALLEYYWPGEIHRFYNPRVGEESWGERGGIKWFINIRRVGSLIGAPNAFGMFLVITAIIAWHKWRFGKNPLFLGIISIYFAGILLLSNARQAIVAFYIIFILIFLRERQYILVIFVGVVSAILAYFAVAKTSMFLDFLIRGHTPSYQYSFGVEWPSVAERLYFWGSAANSLFGEPTHLIYGFGVCNSVLETLIARRGTHNIIFTNLHNYGFIGVLTIGALIFAILRYARRAIRVNQYSHFYVSFLLITISMIIQSFLDDIFYYNNFLMWILFPLIAIFITLSREGQQKQLPNSVYTDTRTASFAIASKDRMAKLRKSWP